MPPHLGRLLYVDDSGVPRSGLAVYGWIECAPDRWAGVLKSWMDMRKTLWREFGIPITRELHATEYVNGRGRISKAVPDRHIHGGVEYWKDFGHEVALECLETLRSTEGLRVGAVYRQGPPERLAETRRECYVSLIAALESELAAADELGMIFMDGDGSDTSYRSTHRSLKLASRRVIEDAIHLESHGSQLIQMADLVAWCANAWITRRSPAHPAAAWYGTYLSERDPAREPRPI